MRNLKRVLSLALALVMVIGMMVMGAGAASADFGDAAEIDYTEAVDVISGLGIMIGDDQGNFNAKDILTREQAAKIICYAMIGAENAEKLGKNTQIFNDVAAGRWSAGYIAYCANLGLLVGYGNGNFGPTDTLTGVQFGKLLLVAAGYNAETQGYVGADWATNIATDMINNGLDIKGVVMSDALTREQAAQMLLQAMDMNTVTYTTGNVVGKIGPYTTGKTFAETYFEDLTKVSGVITANEYADLYDTKALKAGKTEIDGVVYNYSSDLTMIGQSYKGWANGKDILYLADSGKNVVFETGAATDISTAKKFEKVTGLKDGAENFINFAESNKNTYTTDILINYSLDGQKVTTIKADKTLTQAQYNDIYDIFEDDNYDDGFVVVGTKYAAATADDDDVSNDMTFKAFVAKYLTKDTNNTYDVKTNTNGTWLKVIDNDNDGTADYVFQTNFVMAEVVSLSKKGVLTLTGDNANVTFGGEKDDYDFATSAELTKGDIVLYTVIDGVAYVELAPTFTGEVDKYTYKTKLLTVEGEDYEASEIAEYTGYMTDLEDAEKDTEYTYFQDWFGFIRAYALPDGVNGDLVLLTDAYYETNRTSKIYAVKAYLDGEVTDYDVNAKKTGGFIERTNSSNNDWGKLVEFDAKSGTNLARYANNDGVLSLETATTYTYNKDGSEKNILTDYVDLKEVSFKSGETDFAGTYVAKKGFTTDSGEVTVQANKNTVFYYVTFDKKGNAVIETVVGYKNSVDVVDEIVGIKSMYAVATNTWSDADKDYYWVADVIVIETETAAFNLSSDVTLGYNVLNKTVKDYADLEAIKNDATLDELYVTNVDGYDEFTKNDIEVPAFYFNTEDKDGESYIIEIVKNFANYDIFVGTVDRKTALYDYVVAVGGDKLDYDEETVVYALDWNTKNTAIVATTEDDDGDALVLTTGESYIFYAPKGDIVYAVLKNDVTEALYEAIYADANPADETDPADYLYEAKANDEVAVWNEKGTGTKADPFQLVATGCFTEDGTKLTDASLEVLAVKTAQKITIRHAVNGDIKGQAYGYAEDGSNPAYNDANHWVFDIDGVWFDVVLDVQCHDTSVATKDDTKIAVEDDTITVYTTYATETTLTGKQLLAGLTIDEHAVAKFEGGKLTVTAECSHYAEYTVVFAEYEAPQG